MSIEAKKQRGIVLTYNGRVLYPKGMGPKSELMTLKEQIKIVENLIEATMELNGEYQEGWEVAIEDGEKLLKHLRKQLDKLNLEL